MLQVTVLLRSEMILTASAPLAPTLPLTPAVRAVYRCAKQNLSIHETVALSRLSRDVVEQTVCELVSMKMVAVRPPSRPSEEKPAPRPEAPRGKEADAPAKEAPEEKTKNSPEDDAFLRELDAFFNAAHQADHYEFLGVAPDTPRAEMRNRYFELSKRFHPDKAFGRTAAAHKDKMAFVFQKLTLAYDVLSNPKRRAEYNASIQDRLELYAIEKELKAAVSRKTARDAEETSRKDDTRPSGASSSKTERSRGRPSAPSGARMSRPSAPSGARVSRPSVPSGARVSRPSGPGGERFVPSTPPAPTEEMRRETIRRRRAEQAVADLLRRRTDSGAPPSREVLEKHLKDASFALEQERFSDAMSLCKEIMEVFPKEDRAAKIFKAAEEGLSKSQVRMHLRRGQYALREGQIKEAKWHLEQAVAQDKENMDARHLLAEIMLQHERDLFAALALMKEIIVLGGQRSRYFVTLGDIFLEMKDTKRASDAYNKALRIEPENKDLKKKLRLCKK